MSGAIDRRRAVVATALGFLVITAVHAGVGRGTHALHVVHVVFGSLYLLPIVAAAVWVGTRAAIVLALASAAAYVAHARTAWAGDPMENANQLAMGSCALRTSSTLSSARGRTSARWLRPRRSRR